tara:strand:- start:287 stop:541 length:255 start_codon:yes stop_codon:yes gene_type:complete
MLEENELKSLLYKPQKEIPGAPDPEASNRAQTIAGLDKLDVNNMMVIKAKDHQYVHQWNHKNSPKKCKVKRVGLTGFKVVKRLQ